MRVQKSSTAIWNSSTLAMILELQRVKIAANASRYGAFTAWSSRVRCVSGGLELEVVELMFTIHWSTYCWLFFASLTFNNYIFVQYFFVNA